MSRFCVCWMMKTMRNVTMVVLVLITSCHVSENLKIGPMQAQTMTMPNAIRKAGVEPVFSEIQLANRARRSARPRCFAFFC
ncbi:hypothetical protein D3C83_75870 [compost metagenome]